MSDDSDAWKEWIGQLVVVDTNSAYVYLGTLAEVKAQFVVLREADAHDRNEGHATKERYVMEAKQFGIKANRKEIAVHRDMIVSLSRLDDVIVY